ncbi:hypothetical protein LCGC14_2805010 [marine sediment metagenome]|uniref:ATPase domain-containing protein n=1 Tax=marine sediment metagenome TaxID=412755 RepID=A0A0F9AUX1_9ZZZZ
MEVFRTRVGQAAEGDYYFPRDYLDDRFWRKIRNGEQLLVSAPRRIGKTSFLKNICSKENTDYLVKYFIIESADNSDDFFRQLYKKLLEYFSGMKRLREFVGDFLKSKQITKIGRDGIELHEVDLDYFEELKSLITQVALDKKLVFIVDEFSEVVENVINVRGKDQARKFLHMNRELRHEEELIDKIQFVYSGSIGLESLAESIDATKIINDLADFPINPL